MAYNMVEAGVALWSGAEADSIALMGFGLDSLIETMAAGMLLWRLRLKTQSADPEHGEAVEQRVHRFVGGTFLALASLVLMPLAAIGKLRAARIIGSGALRAEAKETLACSYLSLNLLLGLAANATAGWWWADPIAALCTVPWLVKEGVEGVRGEVCCD